MSLASQSFISRALVASISFSVLTSLALPAFAERSEFTLKAPGVVVKQKRGWFGTGGTEYHDAIGNNISHSTGIFGGESVSGGVLGTQISQSRSGIFHRKSTNVTGPNNEVLVQQKTSLLGKKTTVLDVDSMLHNVRGLINGVQTANP